VLTKATTVAVNGIPGPAGTVPPRESTLTYIKHIALMKKITRIILVVALSLFVTTGMSSAKNTPAPTSTWTGTLIDKHCGRHMEAGKLESHEKACVMKCAKNGKDLGVSIDGTWYSFDKKGEKLGWSILKSATADANIQVQVTGKLKGHKIFVTNMQKA
jgi:hypothetical protein